MHTEYNYFMYWDGMWIPYVLMFPFLFLLLLAVFLIILYLIYKLVKNMGLSVYTSENVYRNIDREKFLDVFLRELERRGLKYDKYKDFFMKISIFTQQEKENLRIGVRIEVSPEYLILTIILIIFIPILGILLVLLWIFKFYSAKENINNAINSALSQL